VTVTPIRRRAAALLVALVLVPILAAAADAVVVRGRTSSWRPSSVSINRGERVVWRAVDGNHNVRSYGSNWNYARDLPEGTRVSKRFRSRGTFRFVCTIHGSVSGGTCSGMCGRVVVG
jgi:plastocyanin